MNELSNLELIAALRENAEWCDANEYEAPLCMGDNLRTAAALLERLSGAAADEPLTLEQLRGMDGEPVWIVASPDWGHWELSEDAEDYLEDRDEDFYGMTMPPSIPDQMGRYGLHALGWLAYRRKPEGVEV